MDQSTATMILAAIAAAGAIAGYYLTLSGLGAFAGGILIVLIMLAAKVAEASKTIKLRRYRRPTPNGVKQRLS